MKQATKTQTGLKKVLSALMVLAFFGASVIWPGHSQSKLLDTSDIARITAAAKTSKPTSSARVDVCSSLLNTLQHSPSASPIVRNQRTAGKLAALGMILGARYAIKPETQPTAKQAAAQVNVTTQSAQSIVAYRKCLKQAALASKQHG